MYDNGEISSKLISEKNYSYQKKKKKKSNKNKSIKLRKFPLKEKESQ